MVVQSGMVFAPSPDSESFFRSESLPEYALWKSGEEKRIPFSFDLEVTARCNNACRQCYINLGASDPVAKRQELSLVEIQGIVHQAVDLGALWCLVTGGEPLLRQDFSDIYLMLKKQGLLVSVFTNACLVTPEHVKLFQNYPPRDIEVTVYGISAQTYEKVTRRPGSYDAFRRGLDLLLEGSVKVRLKAMALPLTSFPFIYWYAVIGVPLFLAAMLTARVIGLDRGQMGLTIKGLPFQLFFGLVGAQALLEILSGRQPPMEMPDGSISPSWRMGQP